VRVALVCLTACGRVGFSPVATGDATGDAVPTDCTFRNDVLVNGGFETPLCSPPAIDGWFVADTTGWLDETGRPAISDNNGCGLTGYGCPDWLHADAVGAGCFSEFGDYNSSLAAAFTLTQRVTAPAPVQQFRLRYARATGQFIAGWGFEVHVIVAAGTMQVFDQFSGADMAGVFDSGVVDALAPGTTVDVDIIMQRTGTTAGYGWLWVDDMHLDLCY
jgi:hypothetical protein